MMPQPGAAIVGGAVGGCNREVFLSDGTAHHQHHDNLPTSGPQS